VTAVNVPQYDQCVTESATVPTVATKPTAVSNEYWQTECHTLLILSVLLSIANTCDVQNVYVMSITSL